ncbi:hypothetical protein [Anabaena lutea]|uniref:Uncharacterized protein n=1 Tax=Anabaena lutea FACHB-196 TaxID=2692881 RepID=A0ABR8FMH4_9NOST|nr:hypothetical protein [Anabaena lutea]MBD2571370.1 hypothetical protein [Anabaena lutea FACHB-196]
MKLPEAINPAQVRERRVQKQDLKSFNETIITQNSKISKSLLINPEEFQLKYQTILAKAARGNFPPTNDDPLGLFALANVEYDLARLSDDELEILANNLPIGGGGCDE